MTRTANPRRRASYWHTGLPTRVVEPAAEKPTAQVASDTAGPADGLRFGYTLTDLHQITRLAVHTVGRMASNWHDRYDTAWSAIAEALYSTTEPPGRHDLVRAGRLAIYALVDDDRQTYGYYRRKTDGNQHGAFSSPAFRAYWWDLCGAKPSRSPEHGIVERRALAQILPTLTPRQQQAINALAVHDNYQDAAEALGMPRSTFNSYIAETRRRFLTLWHEGEAPSRVWGCDRRAGTRAGERRSGSVTMAENLRRRAKARQAARQ